MSAYVDVSIYAHRQPPYPSSLNPSITVYYSASGFGGFFNESSGGALLWCGLGRSFGFELSVTTGISDLLYELFNNTTECGFSLSLGHILTL